MAPGGAGAEVGQSFLEGAAENQEPKAEQSTDMKNRIAPGLHNDFARGRTS